MPNIAGKENKRTKPCLMCKRNHDMDNSKKFLELGFNERNSYLAFLGDFFYVTLLIVEIILRF